jgi:plasmid stabilization system protein ParE
VTRDVKLAPDAEWELREAFLWYRERSRLAAETFRTDVFAAIDSLATEAGIWPEDEDGICRYVLRHFPYTIHYEYDARTVTVLAVAHQRRRPGYWQER